MDSEQRDDARSSAGHSVRPPDAPSADFEARWRAGSQPQIEEYLNLAQPAERSGLFRALLALEFDLRSQSGDRPSVQQYLERYPDWEAEVVLTLGETEEMASTRHERGQRSNGASDSPTSGERHHSPGELGSNVETIAIGDEGGQPDAGTASGPGPFRFGRYVTTRLLGSGGAGHVYLAHDEDLDRPVAIKVLRPNRLRSAEQAEQFLAEARLAAGLKHRAIVTIHDLGRQQDVGLFVVMEYIEGKTLDELLTERRLSVGKVVELLIEVAEAAHYAHKAGLVHRDLKPSNVLIDLEGRPHVADFGLAMREDVQLLKSGEVAGTPPYMAPEQIRGEAHRLDGRTDIWALGVMLYEGLLHRRPFSGKNRQALFEEILHRDPKPLRQVNDLIPREVERICLKCLAKRMADRYQSAIDLAEDLKAWLISDVRTETASLTPLPLKEAARDSRVVARGLRAFDREDADFFVALLPGPRDRDGMPESIRSWKARFEECDAEATFPVGLIYGPSGCGKSSLVKAGLLPRLAKHVRPVYIEASADATESRLLAALKREFPDLPASGALADVMAVLREQTAARPGHKVLLVLDQFEQWLHSHPDDPEAELTSAIRHCDGRHLQCLVLVRDDFWMAITEFFHALEVHLVEGVNSAAVELFDGRHARRVLAEFGRSLGQLPDTLDQFDQDQARFLDQSIAELAGPDGKIIPVRLTLFAEMTRHREWTPATLRHLGGIEGIGVTFLEETFCGRSAPPSHRRHWRAAQAVLKALLPEPTSTLKGNVKTQRALQAASGYADRSDLFAELIHILDSQLRMVTPVDLAGCGEEASVPVPAKEKAYQLTHDYLVGPVRQWLTRKQRETRRGRAELRLAAITAFWRDHPERRRLPSPWEWIDILWHTRPATRSAEESRMMNAASRHYVSRAAVLLGILIILVFVNQSQRERAGTTLLFGQIMKADFRHLPELLPRATEHRDYLRPDLERVEHDSSSTAREREVAGLVLYREWPTPARAARLLDRLRQSEIEELVLISEALAAHDDPAVVQALRQEAFHGSAAPAMRLRATCALARLGSPETEDWPQAAEAVAQALLAEEHHRVVRWIALLSPVVPALVEPLARVCRDPSKDPSARAIAAEALAEGLGRRNDSETLARLIVESRPDSSEILLRELKRHGSRDRAIGFWQGVLAERPDDPNDEPRKDEIARRQACAAVALAALDQPESIWPLLRHRADPRLRSLLIQKLAAAEESKPLLLGRLSQPNIDPLELQAVLLVWAEIPRKAVSGPIADAVCDIAANLYVNTTDPAVHAAAELLLRRWGHADVVASSDSEILKRPVRADRWRYYQAPNGHTMAILPGSREFRMGSPAHEKERVGDETLHYRRIGLSIAVATKEVTLGQFLRFNPGHGQDLHCGPSNDCPANRVSWFVAAGYCNWLSELAGIPKEEWCYPVDLRSGVTLSAQSVQRSGFRLPTEAEFEYFARAGTETAYSFGQSEELLPHYGWTWLNSDDRTHPVGLLLPNEFGLFDVHGNMWEWCHDGPRAEEAEYYPEYPLGTADHPAADDHTDQVLMGEPSPGQVTWRLARSGAFDYAPSMSRSAKRYLARSTLQHPYMGFRVVQTMKPQGETGSRNRPAPVIDASAR